jgi:outer membrane assembly lipoprotein YfiO
MRGIGGILLRLPDRIASIFGSKGHLCQFAPGNGATGFQGRRFGSVNKRRQFVAVLLVGVVLLGVATTARAQWKWTPQTGRWINEKRMPKETPELQVDYARSLMLQGDLKKAFRETDKFVSFYGDGEYADQNQFLRGEIRMAQGKYMDAAKEFQQVVAAYPDSELYSEVIAKQYEIGDIYYAHGEANLDKGWWRLFRKRPFRKSIEVYTMVIDNQPFTDEAAEAQYKVGLCHFTLEEYIEAAFEYQRVIEDYASSDWVDEASYGLAMCYYESSLPPDYDQAPSYLTIQAVEDFKVRFPGDNRVADLEEKAAEVRERIATQRLQTAQFYEKRRRFDSARIYYNVVIDQFPDTQAAGEAQEWLSKYSVRDPGGLGEEQSS